MKSIAKILLTGLAMVFCTNVAISQNNYLPDQTAMFNIQSASEPTKILDVYGGSPNTGANIGLWTPNQANGTKNQQFRFESAGNPYYYIVSALQPDMVLEIVGGSTNNGTNVQLNKKANKDAQRFKFKYTTSGTLGDVNIVSKLYNDLYIAVGSDRNNIEVHTRNALYNNGLKRAAFKLIEIGAAPAKPVPFRLVIKGIECKETNDDIGRDDIYLKSRTDGGTWSTGSTHKMNDSDEAVWLAPGVWKVDQSIEFELWEDDDDPNNDDHIGSFTVNTDSKEESEITIEGEGKYKIYYRKIPVTDRSQNIPGSFSFLEPDYNAAWAVGNQGNEGSCVAWSTTACMGVKLVTQILNEDLDIHFDGEKKVRDRRIVLSMAAKSMFDVHKFYNLRGYDGQGWNFEPALKKAFNNTIMFKQGNTNYGVRISNYIKFNSSGSQTIYQSNGQVRTESATPGLSGYDMMRIMLSNQEPLLARFDIHDDFQPYVGQNGIYAGAVLPRTVDSKGNRAGHAVLITGYNYPGKNEIGLPYWEFQNSWGLQWGKQGFGKIVPGSVGIDASMYAIGDIYVCDKDGNRVSESEAIRLIRLALNMETPSPATPVVPSSSVQLNGDYYIINTYGGTSHAYYGQSLSWDYGKDHPYCVLGKEDNHRIKWKIEPIPGKTDRYKIINIYGGASHAWYGAELSWNGGADHPMATVEKNDPVEWAIVPVKGKKDSYRIINNYGGAAHPWYGAELSWDGASPRAKVSVEKNDPVEWIIRTNL